MSNPSSGCASTTICHSILTAAFCLSSTADPSPPDSTLHPVGFLGDGPSSTGSSPSALPASHYTALKSPDSPGALPSSSEPNREAQTAETVTSENSKLFKARDLLWKEPHPLPSPSLSPSEPVWGSSFKHSTEWQQAKRNSAKQSSPLSPTPTKLQLQPESNTSTESLGLSASVRKQPGTAFLNNKQAVNETLTTATSPSDQPLEPPEIDLTEPPADEPYHLSPSSAPFEEHKLVYDINMLQNPEEVLAPGYNVPFIVPQPTSPSNEPTEVLPDDFYPSNTMDVDWGSGDYLETMSFLNPDGEDYSLVTKVPTDSYDTEDYTESYDTSFPSRVGISPSSMSPNHVAPSPSVMTAYSTIVPTTTINPSSSSSSAHFTLDPTPALNSDLPDASDIDWPDSFTIQPTDVLLPDMNSLEYYTIQSTKENNDSDHRAEHRGNITVVSINATELTPTDSPFNDTKVTEDEFSSGSSGFEPQVESTTEETPQLVNISEPSLDPSIVPSHFFDISSSTWGSQVSPTYWSAPTLSVGFDNTASTETLLPTATPLLSSLTDVHWFVTESIHHSTIHTTTVLTATTAFSMLPSDPAANTTAPTTATDSTYTTEKTPLSPEPTSNSSLVPPLVLSDEGATEDGVDVSATVTLIPTSTEAITVSAVPTTKSATPTSHQASATVTATAEASTSVNIIPATGEKTTTTAATSRQYLCSPERPTYLVKIGEFTMLSASQLSCF